MQTICKTSEGKEDDSLKLEKELLFYRPKGMSLKKKEKSD